MHMLGERNDIPRVLAALDIVCLCSSWGEGCPNVIGEAMACAIPCVATNIGDSARVLNQHGEVVEPNNPEMLSKSILRLLAMPVAVREKVGTEARKHIIDNYSIERIANQYVEIYDSTVK